MLQRKIENRPDPGDRGSARTETGAPRAGHMPPSRQPDSVLSVAGQGIRPHGLLDGAGMPALAAVCTRTVSAESQEPVTSPLRCQFMIWCFERRNSLIERILRNCARSATAWTPWLKWSASGGRLSRSGCVETDVTPSCIGRASDLDPTSDIIGCICPGGCPRASPFRAPVSSQIRNARQFRENIKSQRSPAAFDRPDPLRSCGPP